MRTEKYKGILLSTLLVISLVSILSLSLSSQTASASPDVRAPINIVGNANFTPANGVNGGGSGTAGDPYIIENWEISAATAHGIWINGTTAYFVVRNCLVENGGSSYYGIYLKNAPNASIDSNTINNCKFGIYLYSSSNCNIIGNTVKNISQYGINLYISSNNTISNNTCSNNPGNGIDLDKSDNNLVENNTCSNNSSNGIWLYVSSNNTIYNTCSNNSGNGIGLSASSNNNNLSNNTCSNNSQSGIYLYNSSNYNNLTGNTCENNNYGIYPRYSNNNSIYHNNLVNNVQQANDSGTNTWDNGYPSGGNYWSDHTTPDDYSGPNQDIPGSDGIVDNRYDIPGGANQDRYPLVNPWVAVATCGVDVTIENTLLKGYPSQVLEYTIDVHNSGNVVDNIYLSYIPDGWPDIYIDPPVLIDVQPCEHRQATLYVHVPDNAEPCTYKEIIVVAESQFCGATDNDTAQAHVLEKDICGVDVTIENKFLEGAASTVLAYTISVHNSGNIVDNFILSYIPDGWPDITIVPQVLIDVAPCEHRQATMYVHVPDNAEPCTYKEIIVIAESEFCHVMDNDNAMAHVVLIWDGTATFSLVNIYTVNVEKILDINSGSKLVVKFYAYDNITYEGENVIETIVPPVHVEENENARHPGGTGVKNARLDLTTDDTENVISTIASFTVTRDDLFGRTMEIKGLWPISSPIERDALFSEYMDIIGQWPIAPS